LWISDTNNEGYVNESPLDLIEFDTVENDIILSKINLANEIISKQKCHQSDPLGFVENLKMEPYEFTAPTHEDLDISHSANETNTEEPSFKSLLISRNIRPTWNTEGYQKLYSIGVDHESGQESKEHVETDAFVNQIAMEIFKGL
jgi:hypothetical protein